MEKFGQIGPMSQKCEIKHEEIRTPRNTLSFFSSRLPRMSEEADGGTEESLGEEKDGPGSEAVVTAPLRKAEGKSGEEKGSEGEKEPV